VNKLNINGQLFLFADDTALVSSGCTWDEVYDNASSDLSLIKKWFDQNTLTLNIEKTKYISITLRNDMDPGPRLLKLHSCDDPRLATCSCGAIGRVDQYKYLGVVIDSKLSWVPHIQGVKQRLRKMVYAFKQLSEVLTVDQRRTVYYAYVQSVLQYGILAWGGVSANTLQPLVVSQRAIIKVILQKNRRYPTYLLQNDFPVFSVRQLYIDNLLNFIRTNRTAIFTNLDHHYPTRNRINFGFSIPRIRLSLSKSNSFYIAHSLYRKIPVHVLETEGASVAKFKRAVRVWLAGLGVDEVESLIVPLYNY